jgi:outer membrane biosynthesis protein TonB
MRLVVAAAVFSLLAGAARAEDDDDDPKSSSAKPAAKSEAKPGAKAEPPKPTLLPLPAKVEAKPAPKVAPKPEPKPEPKAAAPKPDPLKPELKPEPRPEPRAAAPKPDTKPSKVEVARAEPARKKTGEIKAEMDAPLAQVDFTPPPGRTVRVRLVDGSSIAGNVRAELSESLVIDCNLGLLSIPRSRIATIAYDAALGAKRAPVQALDDDLPPRKR